MSSDDSKCSKDFPEVECSGIYAEELNSGTNKVKSTLKFITWNIDGLDPKNFMSRIEAVCNAILDEQADIVFLQEIIPRSAEYIRKHMKGYHCLFGLTYGYFVGTFLKKSTVSYQGSEIIDFTTKMMRNCLKVKAVHKNKNLVLFNSHLESMDSGAKARKVQLTQIFQEILNSPRDITAIFAGDLNTSDKEVTQVGGLPAGIDDIWIACGSQKECEYTFDTTQNDNLNIRLNTKLQLRSRFDRIYIRHSSPRQFEPISFRLLGLERLHPHLCFPSDHWGILSHFEVEYSESSKNSKKKPWWKWLFS